jgi:hypothetical protein
VTKDHELLFNLLAILFSVSSSIYTFGKQQQHGGGGDNKNLFLTILIYVQVTDLMVQILTRSKNSVVV